MIRREFLKVASTVLGTATLAPWVLEREAAAAAEVDAVKSAFAEAALTRAKLLGASYADIRINRYRSETIFTRERQVQNVSRNQNFGFGVRVLVNGTWGFAASSIVTADEVRRVTTEAVDIARANSMFQRKRMKLAPVEPVVASWKSAFEKDPFDVPLNDKIQFLLTLNEMALKTNGVSFVNSSMRWVNEQKFLATSDGSRIEQYLIRGNPQFTVTAVNREHERLSDATLAARPAGARLRVHREIPLAGRGETGRRGSGREAQGEIRRTGQVRPGAPSVEPLADDPRIGRPPDRARSRARVRSELRRHEFPDAGQDRQASLRLEDRQLRRRPDAADGAGDVRVRRRRRAGAALVPGQGRHLRRLADDARSGAARSASKTSYGCTTPTIRGQRSVPAHAERVAGAGAKETSLDDLIAGVDDGILIDGDGSYSIDQQRYNFQFGGQTFWEIKNGKVGEMLRDVAYQSRTTDFWNACDGLGGRATYELGGAFNDGKGEPGQVNVVSHGAPVARFRQVNVLNTSVSMT